MTQEELEIYRNVARKYGFDITESGSFSLRGKILSVAIRLTRTRIRFVNTALDDVLIASYPKSNPDSLGDFMERYWYVSNLPATV